ncbi:MAG: hypothetical protein ACXABY_21885 [Candidatus Thorarchaeota archaeon]|jgi:hypothetical protein
MATLLPITDRDEGVKAVYQSALRFLNKTNKKIDFAMTRPEAKTVIGELWDQLGDLDYKALISGNIQTAMPDEYVKLLVYATARAQFEQYVLTLPNE